MFFGIPSLRLKGLYLAIATMAAQFIIQYVMRNATWLTGGSDGMSVRAPSFFGLPLNTDRRYYFLVYALVILATLFTKNLTRSRAGRAFVAIRDRYLSAEVMGVNVWGYRILSFGVSSFMVGVAGTLWAHYVLVISDEHFTIGLSVQYLASIIIGGLGSVTGAIYGAIFMTLLPELLRIPERALSHVWENAFTIVNQLREGTLRAARRALHHLRAGRARAPLEQDQGLLEALALFVLARVAREPRIRQGVACRAACAAYASTPPRAHPRCLAMRYDYAPDDSGSQFSEVCWSSA